jgi:hypothetical protein
MAARKPKVMPLELPKFFLFGPDNDPPHRHYELAKCIVPNEHGVQREFRLVTNHPRSCWWVSAVYVAEPGRTTFRASGTLRTTSAAKAAKWERAIRARKVSIQQDTR